MLKPAPKPSCITTLTLGDFERSEGGEYVVYRRVVDKWTVITIVQERYPLCGWAWFVEHSGTTMSGRTARLTEALFKAQDGIEFLAGEAMR